jgi:hypothetical protein
MYLGGDTFSRIPYGRADRILEFRLLSLDPSATHQLAAN